ncbi:MAG: helix-turn-helix domain-containing protein [Lachnospiraceae bacterium]|nr:helix-turn-helix domain-containing protein [Lachnospiraceae bacterium]
MEITYEKFNIRTGKRIKKWRLRRQYTREYLAERAGISPKFLYEIESGKKGCSSYVLYMIAHSLDISVSKLARDEGEPVKGEENFYQRIEGEQKEKVDSILKIIYDMIQEMEN